MNVRTHSPTRIVISVAATFAALAVAAWFAIGVRQSHATDGATAALNRQSHASPAQARTISRRLERADLLYPGQDVRLLRARLLMEQHRWRPAKALIDRATEAEPDNLDAWKSAYELVIAAPQVEPFSAVAPHLHRLDPVDARGLSGHL